MSCTALGTRLQQIESTSQGSSARLILEDVTCDASAQVREFVIASGSGGVTVLTRNQKALMPNGVLGIILSKSSDTVCTVLIRGKISGFTDLPIGDLFVSVIAGITDTPPLTGVVQCIGVRLSATELMFDPKSTLLRTNET